MQEIIGWIFIAVLLFFVFFIGAVVVQMMWAAIRKRK
jgi:hypothetical protein